jgi:uncharacterized lipoprotein YajG
MIPEDKEKEKHKKLIFEHIPEGTFKPLSVKRENAAVLEEEETLNLVKQNLDNDTIKLAMENLLMTPLKDKIKKLNLQANRIGDLGAINVASILDFLPKLQELNMTNNPLTAFGLQIILTKIQAHPNKNIEFLYSAENTEINEHLENVLKVNITSLSPDSSNFKVRVSHD